MKDTELQKLLHQFAIEETPADFTQHIMQRIEATATTENREIHLLKAKPIQAVVGAFGLVLISVLVVCAGSQPIALPFHFTLKLPSGYITQITSFLLVFWVVMLTNQLYQRKEKHTV